MSETVQLKKKVKLKEKKSDTISPSSPKKWPKVFIPIIVVAIIAVVAFLVWPKGDKTNDKEIAQNTAIDVQYADTQSSTTATDNANDNSVENAEQTADEVPAPVEEASETTEATTEESAVAQPATNNTPQKTSSQSRPTNNATSSNYSSGTLTGDVERDAKAVIRGEFGNGAERKAALGNKYQEIQAKVNEFYRDGYGH